MRVPFSWLREYVELPSGVSAREVGDRLIRAGLEVEAVDSVGADLTGPLVLGRVVACTDETHSNGKTVRWCHVDVGESESRGIVCGALNFTADDLVVVALPGAELPGGFAITARKTYGHVSDGMICSERELGLGDEHSGIMVLPADTGSPGDDAADALHLRDDVLDIAVTPDRGYTMSVRGVAREVATAFELRFDDPALRETETFGDAYPVRLDDPGCPVFAAVSVSGFDPATPSPLWMRRRLQLAGTRPISLSVDITNYVMYELGQPIHGYDQTLLSGPIVVRAAQPGEKLVTLDDVTRDLDPEDMVVTDDSGAIGLGGVMGGSTSELSETTADILIEAAYWDPVRIARTSRRQKLSSEASKRFERGVDDRLQAAAAMRVAELLVKLGGGTIDASATIGSTPDRAPITLPVEHVERVGGYPVAVDTVTRRLEQVGCTTQPDGDRLEIVPPSWRPDLTDPNDYAEEVLRLEGFDAIPSVLPVAPPGSGLTASQRLRRRAGYALAAAGYAEVLAYPFVGPADFDRVGLPESDPRRAVVTLTNPLSDEQPGLRTMLLPNLLATAERNVGRGSVDLALFETGSVFLAPEELPPAPRPGVDDRPNDSEMAALEAALPEQPRRLAVVLTGQWQPPGWWGGPRAVSWADAIEAMRMVARTLDVDLAVGQGRDAPWHPGRCAELIVAEQVVGHAGELHPRVCRAYGLPSRSAAAEIDFDALVRAAPEAISAPRLSTYPVAKEDVALVVDAAIPVAEVEAALREGAGDLLESLRLFDVYTGEQIGEGRKSLAFALRLRAADRTLTDTDIAAVKQAAVDAAAARVGAVQRA